MCVSMAPSVSCLINAKRAEGVYLRLPLASASGQITPETDLHRSDSISGDLFHPSPTNPPAPVLFLCCFTLALALSLAPSTLMLQIREPFQWRCAWSPGWYIRNISCLIPTALRRNILLLTCPQIPRTFLSLHMIFSTDKSNLYSHKMNSIGVFFHPPRAPYHRFNSCLLAVEYTVPSNEGSVYAEKCLINSAVKKLMRWFWNSWPVQQPGHLHVRMFLAIVVYFVSAGNCFHFLPINRKKRNHLSQLFHLFRFTTIKAAFTSLSSVARLRLHLCSWQTN